MLSGGGAPFQPDILKDEDRWSGISNKDVGMREVALVAQRARQKMRRYAPTNTFSALLLSTGLLLYVLVGGTKPVQVDQPIPDPVRDFVEQPPHKFVVIAGMERTGSTWQFMAVRQIYRAHGHGVGHIHTHSLQAIFDQERCISKNLSCIVKIHEYEPALLLQADYVLISHRDPRDILLSVSQTFESCLDYSRRTCSGNPDIGLLPKEPPLDVTTHLLHYQKWRSVAHYDMKYELMMKDPVEEIRRLAFALEMEVSREEAEQINAEIDAMAAARKKSRAQWDSSTGLAKDHVHKTNKSDAHKDVEIVTSLSFPNGPCNLEEEFRKIESRYEDFMTDKGYNNPPWTVEMYNNEALLQARATAVSAKRSLHSQRIELVHVVNYFVGSTTAVRKGDQGLHDWEITLTQESVRRALLQAKKTDVDVTFVAAVFPGEETSIGGLHGIAKTCLLTRNRSQHINGAKGPPVPFMQDILQCAVNQASDDAIIIYTNADIGLQEDFYRHIRELSAVSLSEKTSYSVTRRELLARSPHNYEELANDGKLDEALTAAYSADGMDHKGHDTFVMPASVLRTINLGDVTIAYSPWGCTLSALLHVRTAFRVLPKLRWTFHFGTLTDSPDISPGNWISCGEIRNNTELIVQGDRTGGAKTHCGSDSVNGICCSSCQDLRSVARTSHLLVAPSEKCDWQKSYAIARAKQSKHNWAATLTNALASLEALKDSAPQLVRRCCALASRGERSYSALRHHWANPENDASNTCCIVAGGMFERQPPRELLSAWCRVNVVDKRMTIVPTDPLATHRDSLRRWKKHGPNRRMPEEHYSHLRSGLTPKPFDNSAVAGKTVLLFHESTPSTLEGGDFRSYQLALWLCKNGAKVTVITRGNPSPDPSCRIRQRSEISSESEYSRLHAEGKEERHAFAISLIASIGASVVEDDVCLSRTRKALFSGRDDAIPTLGEVDNIFATLWFYRENAETGLSVQPLPSILLEWLDEKLPNDRRPVLSVLSDDIHHERAKAIASVRGDSSRRAEEIELAELAVYAHKGVDHLFAVTNADRDSYIAFRDGKGTAQQKPKIATLPFVSSKILPMPFNCSQSWWEVDALEMPIRPFGNRNGLLYIGSGHYSNSIAVSWILEVVLPTWAFMLQFKANEDRIPGPEEVPLDFSSVVISSKIQQSVPKLLLAGAAKWRSLRKHAVSRYPSLKHLYAQVEVPDDGFVPDLTLAFAKAKLLLAPNFVYGSGISTKIMQGLEYGVPVVVNTHGGNGYDCDDLTDGRLRCAHMQLCGAPTRDGRSANNRTIDGYWYARSAMGLFKNRERWEDLVNNGRRYVTHTRSLSSWNDVLRSVFNHQK